MKRSFHDIEDVFAIAKKVSCKKDKKLLNKVDRIEKRLVAKMIARHEEFRLIEAETWAEAQRTYVL